MSPVVWIESDDVIWRICTISLNRRHRYLLRKNKRLHMPHCPKPRVREARYRRYDRRWRPADAVTLQSHRKASSICSNILAGYSGSISSCSHRVGKDDEEADQHQSDKTKPITPKEPRGAGKIRVQPTRSAPTTSKTQAMFPHFDIMLSFMVGTSRVNLLGRGRPVPQAICLLVLSSYLRRLGISFLVRSSTSTARAHHRDAGTVDYLVARNGRSVARKCSSRERADR